MMQKIRSFSEEQFNALHAKKRSIQIGIFVAILISLAVLAYIAYLRITSAINQQAFARRQALATLTATVIKERFDSFISIGISLASRTQLRTLVQQEKWNDAIKMLERVPYDLPFIERITLNDTHGTLMADTPTVPEARKRDFSTQDWYKGVSKDWQAYLSNMYHRIIGPQNNVIAVAIPLIGDKTPIGILVLQARVENLLIWSTNIDFGPEGFVYFVDSHGNLAAASSMPLQQDIREVSNLLPVKNVLQGKSGVLTFYDPFQKKQEIAAYAPVGNYGWGVVILQPETATLTTTETYAPIGIVAAGFVLLLSIALTIQLLILARANALKRTAEVERIVKQQTQTLNAAFEDLQAKNIAIDQETQKLSVLIENLPIGVSLVKAPEGEIITINKRGVELIGRGVEKNVRPSGYAEAYKTMTAAGTAYPMEKDPISITLAHGIPAQSDDMWVSKPDGTKILLHVVSAPIKDSLGNVTYVVAIFDDITKEEEIDRAKSEFVSLASHQLRTPPATIKWYLDLLLDSNVGSVNAKQKEYMLEVYHSNQRMIDLINALLNASRIELGRFAIQPQSISLPHVIKEVIHDQDPHMKSKKLSIMEDYDPKMPLINADPDLLRIIFQNLLSNSIKYSPEQADIRLALRQKNQEITFTITDHGCGIPPLQQDKIFTKLFRADNARIIDPEGNGLGLYMVKAIVDAIGGRIWFTSKLNKGTTFYVVLPIDGMAERKAEHKLASISLTN